MLCWGTYCGKLVEAIVHATMISEIMKSFIHQGRSRQLPWWQAGKACLSQWSWPGGDQPGKVGLVRTIVMQHEEIFSKRRTNLFLSWYAKTGSITGEETCRTYNWDARRAQLEGGLVCEILNQWQAHPAAEAFSPHKPLHVLATYEHKWITWICQSLSSTFKASLADSGMQTEQRWSRSFSVVLRVRVLCVRRKG